MAQSLEILDTDKLLTVKGGGEEKIIFMSWYRMLMFRQLSLSGWDSSSHLKNLKI